MTTPTPDPIAALRERDAADWEMVSGLADRHRANDAPVPPSWQAVEDRHTLLAALAAVTKERDDALAREKALVATVEPLLRARHKQAHNGDIYRGGAYETCPLCEPVRDLIRASRAASGEAE